jgi:DNA-binding SARP family transcriptional activator/tetratricopeptide (TPR) repeat protein
LGWLRIAGMEIGVLGPFQALSNGQHLPLGGQRQRSVLAILTLEVNRAIPSERLIELLWGDNLPSRSAAVLQTYIANLRKVLEPGGGPYKVLTSRAAGYELCLPPDSIDAYQFEEGLRLGRQAIATKAWEQADALFAKALQLWRGPALGEFAGERFALAGARRLEELRLVVTEDRFDAGLRLGRHQQLVPELESFMGEHPLRERVACQLMVALYRAGRQAEASGVFQQTRRRLSEDLGMEPGPDMQKLLRQILNQDPELDWTLKSVVSQRDIRLSRTGNDPSPAPNQSELPGQLRTLCPVLIARQAELTQLEDALISSLRGAGRSVVVAGDAGVGKTRLAWELSRVAQDLGCQLMGGSCSSVDLTLPYLPILEALGNWLNDRDLDQIRMRLGPVRRELAQLLPQLGDDSTVGDVGDPAQNKPRLFEAVLEFLRIVAQDSGLVLVINDLQWADVSTCELVDHLSRRLRNSRILVIITCRLDELHRQHPVRATIHGWQRSGLAKLIELQPLSSAGVREMLQTILADDSVTDEFQDFMHLRSEGNPFVLEEILREAIDRHGAGPNTDLKGWNPEELSIPRTVREAILQRVSRLSRDEMSLIYAAAVLGPSFPYQVLPTVCGLTEDSVRAALRECVDKQLLEAVDGQEIRFRHAITRDAIYEDLLAPERVALHRQAAAAIRRLPETPAAEVAHHLILAGERDDAVPLLIRAAEEAKNRLGYHEAAGLYERAVPHVPDELARARLECKQGEAYYLAGEPARAVPLLESSIPLLEKSGVSSEPAGYRLTLGTCLYFANHLEEARLEYEKVKARLEPDGPSETLARAYVRLAQLFMNELDTEQGLAMASLAVQSAEACAADSPRLWGLNYRGCALVRQGLLDEGFPDLDRSWQEALERGFSDVAFSGLVNAILMRIWCFRAAECSPLFERLDRIDDPVLYGGGLSTWAAYHRAGIHIRFGEMPAARMAGTGALQSAQQTGSASALIPFLNADLAIAECALGHNDAARGLIQELEPSINRAYSIMRVSLDIGDLDRAVETAAMVASHVQSRQSLVLDEVWQLDKAIEVFLAADSPALAARLQEKCAGAPRAMQPLLDRVEGRMALFQHDLTRAEERFSAAASFLHERLYRDDEWRTRRLLAEAKTLQGNHAGAEVELQLVIQAAQTNGHFFELMAARKQLQQVSRESSLG